MAQLGYHVSMGLDLWDYPVRKGTVLYLALEDDYARLQKRLSRMFGMESSENFYFATIEGQGSIRSGVGNCSAFVLREHKIWWRNCIYHDIIGVFVKREN